ncbi:uncharacterized protein PpBr36_06078 [Pyricularia pennisetigena]|uniref:uncharacterized protein n=1 Tax=Pyricularia pennisetigena TaxID=1578925 RepID=UPI0011516948|nr:uncharacterized protein PpBr36_06078 [Pyricularia pennisetigena]TLS23452.1 hypothetical protein PpBr36_06078 [Pyricularia pennisetigena]
MFRPTNGRLDMQPNQRRRKEHVSLVEKKKKKHKCARLRANLDQPPAQKSSTEHGLGHPYWVCLSFPYTTKTGKTMRNGAMNSFFVPKKYFARWWVRLSCVPSN